VPTGNAYQYLNGTSMATPITAGVAGMIWAANPELTAGEVKEILISTATEPVLPRTQGDDGTYYMIDALAAVEAALGTVSDDPTDPPADGTLELPSLEAYLGEDNYTMVQVNQIITEKYNKDATGYKCILAVNKDDAGLLDSYITLLETYGFQLVSQEDGEYRLRYTAANAPTPFSQEYEDSYHVSLVLADEGDTFHVTYLKHKGFTTVEIPFSEAG
jgi:subtilisin family serine protease